MVKCPKCKSEYYTISYISEYGETFEENEIARYSKVICDDCHAQFFIRELFTFKNDENYGDYFEEEKDCE